MFMNITEELERLGNLHKDGSLSNEEFALAKEKLLNQHESGLLDTFKDNDNSFGKAANRYVTFQIVMAVIGFIVFLIVFFGVILPHINSDPSIQFGPRFP